ncbi:hypothetical protein [Leeuwenhoekiella aequorea]|nr:hypothetical protein [Leeuwenhoekiella aequorea]
MIINHTYKVSTLYQSIKLIRICILFLCILLCSCGSRNTEPRTSQSINIGCYGYTKNGDTITLKVIQNDSIIKAALMYKWAEKDKNDGKFEGVQIGNRIRGLYTFTSEGIVSKREMVFKIEDSSLVEGYGETVNSADSVYFKDTDKIKFNTKMPFKLGNCIY